MSQMLSTTIHKTTGRGDVVLFDLDGTLTRPYFDFAAIRREIGLPVEFTTPILESIALMPPSKQERARAILFRHERQAALNSELWEDSIAVIDSIRANGLPVGLMTRNSRLSAETVIAKHRLRFDLIHTREDGPSKPLPDPVLTMCARFGVSAERAWVVGDYLFDLQCGNAAGATTVLMIGDADRPDYADQADHVIRRLTSLLDLLELSRGQAVC